ncbi:hypothetical protein L615_003300000170 [Nocardioides sp. J9]|uniref:hypothetical protein n=1 Tax=unclassified Nocardioides TaxID=2615069 RepID=UPI00048C7653|nr:MULTISPECIES: hypothetical protein [unclassified Nocardioides]TWG97824.1 hypothetical protein L615_003300000170 [Nocardioides sp. J9]
MSARRPCAAGKVAGAALLAAALAIQPVPTSAATPTVTGSFDAGGFLYRHSSATCPATAAGDTTTAPVALPADGAWHTTTGGSGVRTYAGTRWSRSVSTTARITRDARGGVRVDVRANAASSIRPNPTATCGFDDEVAGTAEVEVTLPVASWVVARSRVLDQAGNGQAHGHVGVSNWPGPLRLDVTTGGTTKPKRFPAGTYDATFYSGARTSVSTGTTAAKAHDATVLSSATFMPVGTRRTLRGNGRSLLVPGHRRCATHSVRVAFSAALRARARAITITVDGTRRVRLTGKGVDRSALVLRKVAPRTAGVVRASVVLRSGARRTMTTTSWPCT